MTSWVAVSYGALDVRGAPGIAEGVEVLVTPTLPGTPLGLVDVGAALWERLAREGPVEDDDLNDDERVVVAEMVEIGLASADAAHPARHTELSAPWLSSPMHELVYALVASVARDTGIDAVFIKGPVLHAQGLREREHSGDVDVWVDPSRVDALAAQMEPWGWARQPDIWGHEPINHSVTLGPCAGWGCEIDVHRRLPGLTLPDASAFAVLSRRVDSFAFAGIRCSAPDQAMHAVLGAVHVLRPEIGRGEHPQAAGRASHVLRQAGPASAQAAAEIGATSVLARSIRQEFPDSDGLISPDDPPRDWAWRAQPNKLRAYLIALRQVSWWRRPRVAFRLIWPTAAVAQASESLAGVDSQAHSARVRRLHRGLHGLVSDSRRTWHQRH